MEGQSHWKLLESYGHDLIYIVSLLINHFRRVKLHIIDCFLHYEQFETIFVENAAHLTILTSV